MINYHTFHSLRSSSGPEGRNGLKGWTEPSSPLKWCDLGGVAWGEGSSLLCPSVWTSVLLVTLAEDSKELPCGSSARLFPRHLNRNITCFSKKVME